MLNTEQVKKLIDNIKSVRQKWHRLEKVYLNCNINPDSPVKLKYDQIKAVLDRANSAIDRTHPGIDLFDERTVIRATLINGLQEVEQQTLIECIENKLQRLNKEQESLDTLEIYIKLFQELPLEIDNKRSYVLNNASYAKKFNTIHVMLGLCEQIMPNILDVNEDVPKEIKARYDAILKLISGNTIVFNDKIMEKNEEEFTHYLETATEEQIYANLSLLEDLTKRNTLYRGSLLDQIMIYLEVNGNITNDPEEMRNQFLNNIENLRTLLTDIKNKYGAIINLNDQNVDDIKAIYNHIYNFMENKKGTNGNSLGINFLDAAVDINDEYKADINNKLQNISKGAFFSFIYNLQDIIYSRTLSFDNGIDISCISKIDELKVRDLLRQKRAIFRAENNLLARKTLIETAINDAQSYVKEQGLEDQIAEEIYIAQLANAKKVVEAKIEAVGAKIADKRFEAIVDLKAREQDITKAVINFSINNNDEYILDEDERSNAIEELDKLVKKVKAQIEEAENFVDTEVDDTLSLSEKLEAIKAAIIKLTSVDQKPITDAEVLAHVTDELERLKANAEANITEAENAVATEVDMTRPLSKKLKSIKAAISKFNVNCPPHQITDAEVLEYVQAKLDKLKKEVETKIAKAEAAVDAQVDASCTLAETLEDIEAASIKFASVEHPDRIADTEILEHATAKLDKLKAELEAKKQAVNIKIAAKNFENTKDLEIRLKVIEKAREAFSNINNINGEYIIDANQRSYAFDELNKLKEKIEAKIRAATDTIADKKFGAIENLKVKLQNIEDTIQGLSTPNDKHYIADEDERLHALTKLKELKGEVKAKRQAAKTKIAAKNLDQEVVLIDRLKAIADARSKFSDDNNANEYIADAEVRLYVLNKLDKLKTKVEAKIKAADEAVEAKKLEFMGKHILRERLALIVYTIDIGNDNNDNGYEQDADIRNHYLAKLEEIANTALTDLQTQVWKDLKEARARYTKLKTAYDAKVPTLAAGSAELRDLQEAGQAVYGIMVGRNNVLTRDLSAGANVPIVQGNITTGFTKLGLIDFAEELSKLLHGPEDELITFASVESKLLTPEIVVGIAERYFENGPDMDAIRAADTRLEGFNDYAIGEILKHVVEQKGPNLAQELKDNFAAQNIHTNDEVEAEALALALRGLQTPEVQRSFSTKVMEQIDTNNDPFLSGFVSACKSHLALQDLASQKVQEVLATGVADEDELKEGVKAELANLVRENNSKEMLKAHVEVVKSMPDVNLSQIAAIGGTNAVIAAVSVRSRF